ncbi:hypothetical protein N7495_005793 [Penicillium taxi]|uniref:uncharacterized protein n=1 Tax=Penicillium taxi TaxID=168475 RepID=UPI0025450801|nr:uncharacterized protein N7495_005793 [Penicillium taxi]KAJ5894102.1 hypothetical protein N7495_005793 [Penicillium taxi]
MQPNQPIIINPKELINPPQGGPWQKLWAQPYIFLAWKLHNWQGTKPATPLTNPITIEMRKWPFTARMVGRSGYMEILIPHVMETGPFNISKSGYLAELSAGWD